MSQSNGELLRFDGRVAIVTGSGGQQSLGRAYAHLLASRGAKVVVNDLGVGPDGRGAIQARADAVAQEIIEAGGEAIADTHSVADADSARAMVQAALDTWGRVDIVINNAGLNWPAAFDEITEDDLLKVANTHFMGSIWVCRAAWPEMKRQQYGRIVNVCSGAMFGDLYVAIYSAAKAGVYGLTRGLAVEGVAENIRVNALMPFAWTEAVDESMVDSDFKRSLMRNAPEQVAPTVAYLAHESCSVTGKAIKSGGGLVAEVFASSTVGYSDAELTPEGISAHLETILDRTDAVPITEADSPARRAISPKPYGQSSGEPAPV
jgi:NAD(P)-dependent dehydrogenase (short-subunit alcohol dehydrogenase family)